jgi:hypothetical protein
MLLLLDSLQLQEPLGQSGECLVLAELILPRNGIARRSALREIKLSRGKRSLSRQPFYDKALLKERVDGRFGLKVRITRPLKHRELTQFLRQLLAAGIESGADLLSRPTSLLGDLTEEAGDRLADALADDAPQFIASGGLELDSESLATGKQTIELALNQTLRSSQHLPLSQKKEKRKSAARTYRKGTAVGRIVLKLDAEG